MRLVKSYPQQILFPFACWGLFSDFVRNVVRGTLPSAVTLQAVLLRPRSTGTVEIFGPSTAVSPRIDPAYFSDPDGADLAAMVAAIRKVRALAATPPLREWCGEEMLPGKDVTSDAGLAAYARSSACHFLGSLCGTCRMGPEDDGDKNDDGNDDEVREQKHSGGHVNSSSHSGPCVSGAPAASVDALPKGIGIGRRVVDEKLRVVGCDGLRVVDASVIPGLLSGQINGAVTMIAERAAGFVIDCYGLY